jgi:hypothetical protein
MKLPVVLKVVLAALLLDCALMAQSTFATLTGVIADPSGAAIPDAEVEARDVKTGYVYTTRSNSAGQYTFANLRDGDYLLKVKAAGFADFEAKDILLSARDIRRLDATLQVGTTTTSVEVSTSGVALIETETARISDIKDREQLRQLPLTLRRAWDYFQLSPNVSRAGGGFQIRFSGSRNNQGDVAIDGTTIQTTYGGPAMGPVLDYTESYQEMRIDSAGNSAEFAGIGQVSIATRGGSNEWRGTLADYYSTRGFNARNPFALVNTGAPGHRLIASVGGPILIPKIYNGRNRTFFFYTAEWNQGAAGLTNFRPTVPLASWRNGDFSRESTMIRDPFANNAPFPGNIIPRARLNPTALAIQERFYPLPNIGDPNVLTAQNYFETRPNIFNSQYQMTGRADHRFNDNLFAFFRISWVDWEQNNLETSLPSLGIRPGNRWLRSWTVNTTYNIRPTLLNEFRFGFASDNIPQGGPLNGNEQAQELGLRGLAGDLPNAAGLYAVSWANLGLTGISQTIQCIPCAWNRTVQAQDNVIWFRGKHSVKMGFSVLWSSFSETRQGANLFGGGTFTNRYTGHSYADFLLGIPSSANRNFPALPVDQRRRNYAGFVQDDWKISQRLTLNLGLRYEYAPGWTETSGRQAVFDIASGKIVVPNGALDKVSPLMPRGYVDVVEASQANLPSQTLVRADRNNFAPRVGVAWRPFGPNTVVRAGYGLYYDLVPRNPAAVQTPFNIVEPTYTNTTPLPALVLPQVFPSTGTGGPTTVTIPAGIQANIRIPFSMQYTTTIEHQWADTGFRVSYIGTNTRQGVWVQNVNQPVADGRLFVDKPRPYPNFPAVNFNLNGAGHQYHAATFEVERRTRKGLTAQFYFTWARDIGDLENGESPEDAYNRDRERAVWQDIPTKRLSTNFLYELPVGRGKKFLSSANRWVNGIIGGWQVTSIYTWDSGYFLTPAWTGPDPTGTRFTPNRTPAVVTLRPDHLCDANLDDRTPTRWFNADCFAAPGAGRFGTAAKGVIKGPGVNVMHSSLSKTFLIRERVRLRLEGLATNTLNTPNWDNPNTNITATGQTGVIGATVNRNNKLDSGIPRVIQLHVRLDW